MKIKVGELHWFNVFGRQVAIRISKDWDGYDCGLINFGVASEGKDRALRVVIWRLAAWLELSSKESNE